MSKSKIEKVKKIKFNKTNANVIAGKIVRNAKEINIAENQTSSLIMVDIIELASYCSSYDYKDRTHTSYIKSEILKDKHLYGSKKATISKVNRLFECSNSPIMRAIYGENQTVNRVQKTLSDLKLDCQESILEYKKLYNIDSVGNLTEKPIKENVSSEIPENEIVFTDKEFCDNLFKQIEKRKVTDQKAIAILTSKLVAYSKILLEEGYKDTIKKVA